MLFWYFWVLFGYFWYFRTCAAPTRRARRRPACSPTCSFCTSTPASLQARKQTSACRRPSQRPHSRPHLPLSAQRARSLPLTRRADRVGVWRLLRLGATLKPNGDGFDLDLSAPGQHKTASVYGPTVTTISPLIVPWLKRYLSCTGLLGFHTSTGEKPFLFHPHASVSQPHGSAQWSRIVQASFRRHSIGNVALSPKDLRSSFITFVKDQKDASLVDVPAVLKAASVAMRHTSATQGGAAYDKRVHDRAIHAATSFCERFARRFVPLAPVRSAAA